MPTRFYTGHTAAGSAATALILSSFRLHGALLAAGDRLTGPVGLTAARWQVLGSVVGAAQPSPVAHVARDMSLTRQSVQRLADQLVADGLLAFEDNPHHKRAPLVVLTERGRKAFESVTARQVPWVNRMTRGFALGDIETATSVLRRLEERANAIDPISSPESRPALRPRARGRRR